MKQRSKALRTGPVRTGLGRTNDQLGRDGLSIPIREPRERRSAGFTLMPSLRTGPEPEIRRAQDRQGGNVTFRRAAAPPGAGGRLKPVGMKTSPPGVLFISFSIWG